VSSASLPMKEPVHAPGAGQAELDVQVRGLQAGRAVMVETREVTGDIPPRAAGVDGRR
jgi:hypothetical protein